MKNELRRMGVTLMLMGLGVLLAVTYCGFTGVLRSSASIDVVFALVASGVGMAGGAFLFTSEEKEVE